MSEKNTDCNDADVDVDVLILSASRPAVLRYSLQSFSDKLKFCKTRFFINEDVVNESLSKEITAENNPSINIVGIKRNKKPQGPLVGIINFIQSSHCQSKYIFIVEDDWELEVDIDVKKLFEIMDKDESVNSIILKYKPKGTGVIKTIAGIDLNLSSTPLASPSLWRVSNLLKCIDNPEVYKYITQTPFIKLRIPVFYQDFYQMVKQYKTTKDKQQFTDYLEKNVGAYIYCSPYVLIRHLGNTWKRFDPNQTENEMIYREIDPVYYHWRCPDFQDIPFRPVKGRVSFNKEKIEKNFSRFNDPEKYTKELYPKFISYLKVLYEKKILVGEEWQKYLDFRSDYSLIKVPYNSSA